MRLASVSVDQASDSARSTASTTGVLFAASKGVSLLVPVSMARESTKTFSTSYLALADSDARLVSNQIDLFRALGGGWQSGDRDMR